LTEFTSLYSLNTQLGWHNSKLYHGSVSTPPDVERINNFFSNSIISQ